MSMGPRQEGPENERALHMRLTTCQLTPRRERALVQLKLTLGQR